MDLWRDRQPILDGHLNRDFRYEPPDNLSLDRRKCNRKVLHRKVLLGSESGVCRAGLLLLV